MHMCLINDAKYQEGSLLLVSRVYSMYNVLVEVQQRNQGMKYMTKKKKKFFLLQSLPSHSKKKNINHWLETLVFYFNLYLQR